ncbi:unnamed protein product [Ilex paraguariensis]|uniref:RING-type domain-containing protein n=1 Tax=Ilex paraguariensis TaxID=185542 RepID=A0ABC8S7L2_9AQUA
MDIMDGSLKVPNVRHSHLHHNNRSAPRNFYGHQYSRRNSASHAETSTSRGKGTPLRNEQQSFKLATQPKLDSGCYTDSRDRFFCRPERIRSSSSAMDAISPDVVKMVCGICQKLLKRRPYILENTVSSSDISVVAVLVCGHVYHADCLEQRTCHEDRRDPACPLCLGHDDMLQEDSVTARMLIL